MYGKYTVNPEKGENTGIFTIVLVKRVVGGFKIESKGLCKIIYTLACVRLPPFPHLLHNLPLLSMNTFIILKAQLLFYIFKTSPLEGRNIRTMSNLQR